MRNWLYKWCIIPCLGVLWISIFLPLFAYDINTDFPYGDPDRTGEEAIDLATIFKEDAVDPSDSASEQIQSEFNIDLDQDQRATEYIKEVINRVLAIVWLVATVVLLYGFYQLVFSDKNDDTMSSARKIIITALVALLIIGFAWIIVSQFFDIFFQVRESIDA